VLRVPDPARDTTHPSALPSEASEGLVFLAVTES
jgi:hypothetical protein